MIMTTAQLPTTAPIIVIALLGPSVLVEAVETNISIIIMTILE